MSEREERALLSLINCELFNSFRLLFIVRVIGDDGMEISISNMTKRCS